MTAERREVPYAGWVVNRIVLDWQFRLILVPDLPYTDQVAEVVIESPFLYLAPDGARYEAQPGPPQTGIASAIGLQSQRVTQFTASIVGDLALTFADGSSVCVAPDPQYESWSVTGPGISLLCRPGGGDPWSWAA